MFRPVFKWYRVVSTILPLEGVAPGLFEDFTLFAHVPKRFKVATCFQMRSFPWISMDPTIFQFKIHESSRPGAKCYFNIARRALGMEIHVYSEMLPHRAQNAVFSCISMMAPSKIVDDFQNLERFHNFAHSFEYFKLANALHRAWTEVITPKK